MSQRYSIRSKTHIEYCFWLVFGDDGSMRFLRSEPSVARGERAMSCTAKLPLSLFNVPVLSAKISVADAASNTFNLDIEAASEALKQAIGVDIDLQIRSAE